jgi:hypothetical protein
MLRGSEKAVLSSQFSALSSQFLGRISVKMDSLVRTKCFTLGVLTICAYPGGSLSHLLLF